MPSTPIPTSSSTFPNTSATTADGVSHIDLNFATSMSKGSGSIFITDGTIQTVIDRATGQPKLRVVGATFTKEITLDQVHVSGTHVLFDAAGLPAGHSWNVYMGAGTLLAGGKPIAALTVPGSATFTTPDVVVEPPPPSLSATIAIASGVLKAGAPLEMTVSFSHAVTGVASDSVFTAEHARVEYVSRSEDGKTWNFRLVQDDSVDVASNLVRMNLAAVQPRDAVAHSGTVVSSAYAVDTLVDSFVGQQLDINDWGASDSDGITNDTRQVVSGTLVGTIDEGEHLQLTINGRDVAPEFIEFSTEDGITTWHYDSEDERVADEPAWAFQEGANTIQARVVGNGHESPLAVRTITVDSQAPGVASAPNSETPFDSGAPLVVTFTEAMHWFADTEAGEPEYATDVVSIWAGDLQHRINWNPAWLSADGRTLTIPASAHELAADTYYRVVLPSTLTDTAGNPLGEYEIYFQTQDHTPPSANHVAIYGIGNQYLRAGQDITFRILFDEQIATVGDAQPALILSNGKEARLSAVYGDQMEFVYTVAAGDDIGDLSIQDTSQLIGNVEDRSGNLLDAAHIVFDGVHDSYGAAIDIQVDTVAPGAPAAPTLDSASDTGTIGDGSTSDLTPTLTGIAEANARIYLYDGTASLGSVTANASGVWSKTLESLTEGVHNITIKQRDRAGNESPASANFALTIVPAGEAPTVTRTIVSGTHAGTYINEHAYREGDIVTFRIRFNESIQRVGSDELSLGLSNGARATFSGIGGAGNTEAIFTYTVGANQSQDDVTIISSTLAGKLADLSGNVLDAASIVFGDMYDDNGYGGRVDIDTVAPAKPNRPALNPDSNSGSKDDLVTSDSTPTLGGIGAEAGARVEIYEGDTLLGWTYADGGGLWNATVDAGHALAAGLHNLTIRQLDAAGNRSVASDVLALTLDLEALAPSAPTLANASDSGTLGDRITNDSSPTLSGSAEAYAHVEIYEGTTQLGSADADADGVWSTTIGLVTPLADGVHSLTVVQTDRAGNVSPASGALALTIDTAAAAPAAPSLESTSDSGTLGDGLTSDATPTLSGTAEAFASIEIYEGATLRGSATANGSGVWSTTLGTLTDGLHNLTVKQTDRAGNTSAASSALALTIDTAPPAALAVPGLANDTGLSATDRVTKETLPVLRGSGAEAHAAIDIMLGDVRVGDGLADENGVWQAYFNTPLAEGTHTFTVFQLDRAGNGGAASAAFTVTVDTTRPNPPNTPVLDSGSDGGALGDGLTNDRTPTLRGTADADTEVVLYVNEREVGRTSTNASGSWSFTLDGENTLVDGLYSIGLKQFDLAGNLSGFSDGFDLTIDGSAPAAPGAPQLATASDTGASNSDGITSDTTPTLYGSGAEAGATIVLYSGASEITRFVADGSGNWEYTFPEANALADGNYAFSVLQIDKVGNASSQSGGRTVVIDTDPPAITSFATTRALREFKLGFDETIVFRPSGQFSLLESASTLLGFRGNSDANWYTSGGSGGANSVLNFKISMDGLFNLVMNNDAVQDMAGNVAQIIGTPDWSVDLRVPL